MNIAIVGLGLIGGSIARRIRGFSDGRIFGINRSAQSLQLAMQDGVIDESFTEGGVFLEDTGLIILCLYPEANIEFIRKNAKYLKKGTVITDVSGVKGYMANQIKSLLPDGVAFVGGHPMAGREVGGYQSSTDTLFNGASFIITPTDSSSPSSVELIRSLAEYIGCAHVVTTTPEEHDEIIAYTSQLMHVMAVALCLNPMIERSTFFSAGSLRDCTRVAVINETMWSELFLENKNALSNRITEMQDSLELIKSALKNNDREKLMEIMKTATEKKRTWLME